VSEQRVDGEQLVSLQSERGRTTMSDAVVAKIAGISVLEVEGIQMGSGAARAVGGFLDSVTGGGGGHQARGVSVEVGEEEAAVELSMSVEYRQANPAALRGRTPQRHKPGGEPDGLKSCGGQHHGQRCLAP
jgi:hypothetical protein